MIKLTNQHLLRQGGDKTPPQISKYLWQTKEAKTIRRCRRWQVGDCGGGGKNFQLSVKGMSAHANGNSWKGHAKRITSLLYSTKHIRSPDWPGSHRLHTADKKREMPRNKMTLWFQLLIMMFVLFYIQVSHWDDRTKYYLVFIQLLLVQLKNIAFKLVKLCYRFWHNNNTNTNKQRRKCVLLWRWLLQDDFRSI